eukprot:364494-Chlamydomonas_euryale.AAC.1
MNGAKHKAQGCAVNGALVSSQRRRCAQSTASLCVVDGAIACCRWCHCVWSMVSLCVVVMVVSEGGRS